MGSPLHRVSGAAGPGRALTLPPVLLLASPDDYLLELERRDTEAAWLEAHPGGELETLALAPPAGRLVQALVSPSLFAPVRLVVVRDAAPYLEKGDKADPELPTLIQAIDTLSWEGVGLLLAAVVTAELKGPLAEAVARRGEVRALPLPEPPKPWDQLQLSPRQRTVLLDLLRRTVPGILAHDEAVAALLDSYGFRPRELVQAAESALASGAPTAEAVRVQAGPGEVEFRDLEEALLQRRPAEAARLLGILAAGGRLLGWRGEVVDPEKHGAALAAFLERLLRQALAVRGHARAAGLEGELDPDRCAHGGWYPKVFKSRLFPRLSTAAEEADGSPVASLSAWQLHRVFRFAAAYDERTLLSALAVLAASGAERDRGWLPLAHVTSMVVGMVVAAETPG